MYICIADQKLGARLRIHFQLFSIEPGTLGQDGIIETFWGGGSYLPSTSPLCPCIARSSILIPASGSLDTQVVIGPPCPVGSARELNQIQHTLPSLIYTLHVSRKRVSLRSNEEPLPLVRCNVGRRPLV